MVCGGGEQVGERARGDPEDEGGGDADEQGGRHGGGHRDRWARQRPGRRAACGPQLRTSAAKATAISSMAAPSTQASRASASDRAMASSLANIANGGSPSSTISPTVNDAPISRERRTTPVMSAMVVEPCAACSWPPARNSTVLPMPWASTCSSSAAIASVVPAAAAIAIRPMFSIDEYASIRLTSPVTVSISAATSSVANPITSSPVRRNPGPTLVSMIGLIRISTENATDEQHPAHQRTHRCRGLAVCVGQPGVKREQAGLGAVPDQQQATGQPGHPRVQAAGVGERERPGSGRVAAGAPACRAAK